MKSATRHQRRVEKEYRKKYKAQVLGNRGGVLLPPTIWNYRKALVFSTRTAQDMGELLTNVSPGGWKTSPPAQSDHN